MLQFTNPAPQTEYPPCHQARAEKMHANQIVETSEPIICDQLHVQPKVSSFRMTPDT